MCTDRSASLHYLEHLNYYRLAAYWLPFETEHTSHTFQTGTTFREVMDLYNFDRELRLLVLDAIERVEVSTRAAWSYVIAHRYGPHGHLEASCFKQKGNKWDHAANTQKLGDRVRKSREVFMRHYREKYDEPLPPVWVTVEAMTLGELSKWYENLRHGTDRNAVAHKFDLDETNFASFLHHLTTVRNLCAHHSRLWNREFTFTFKLPRKRPLKLALSLCHQGNRRIYNTLTMLAWLMDAISPNHHWRVRLNHLHQSHNIDLSSMGFPRSWNTNPVWRDSNTAIHQTGLSLRESQRDERHTSKDATRQR